MPRPRLCVIEGDACAAEQRQRVEAQIRNRRLRLAALDGLRRQAADEIATLEAQLAPEPPEAC